MNFPEGDNYLKYSQIPFQSDRTSSKMLTNITIE